METGERIKVAVFLQSWFESYARLSEGPATTDRDKRLNWLARQSEAWNGLRNLSRDLAEWAERNTPRVDPSPLHKLSGSEVPLGGLPREMLKAAWVTARRLQSIVGTVEQAQADFIIARLPAPDRQPADRTEHRLERPGDVGVPRRLVGGDVRQGVVADRGRSLSDGQRDPLRRPRRPGA